MKEPRVKEIIKIYEKGNIKKVHEYLTQEDMIIDPSTWAGKIKKMIEAEQYNSAKQIIELTAYKFINHDKI
jgi:hypothetical protein